MPRTKMRDLALGILREIGDGTITSADFSAGAIDSAGLLGDGIITTAKLADSAVTDAKISGMSSSKLTGALPAIDGGALTGISAGLPGPRAEVFTSSGTFTVPTGVTAVKVTVVGGGGGGGSASVNHYPALGGGGGGTAIKYITGLTSGGTVSVTIGAGGTGATAGAAASATAGGTSSFGAYCSATGGGLGLDNWSSASWYIREGGVGSGGDINLQGGNCGVSSYVSGGPSFGGGGGTPTEHGWNWYSRDNVTTTMGTATDPAGRPLGPYGGRPGSGDYSQSSVRSADIDATGYGCGGGGATQKFNGTQVAGGDGYQGIVIVEY